MKVKLALAFALLLFATIVRADSLTDGNGTIYYPDGSTITYYDYVPSTAVNGYLGTSTLYFSFADGTGTAFNYLPAEDEEFGALNFTSPASDLEITWVGAIYMNFVGPNGEIESIPGSMNALSGETFIAGPVTEMSWDTITSYSAAAGISSFTEGVPEPSSLLLSGIGLAALLCLFVKLKIRATESEALMIRVMRSFEMRLRPANTVLLLAIVFMAIAGITQPAEAQTFTVIYSFDSGHGAAPVSLVPPDNNGNLYGTSSHGGCATCGGLVFKLSSDGEENVLHVFPGVSDGMNPEAGLVRDPYGNLYGTTFNGGGSSLCTGGCGVVFTVNLWGSETVLHRFAGGSSDGSNPSGSLVVDNADNLYGTTTTGGAFGKGTVFMLDKDGTETVLYSFTGKEDGETPSAGLVRDLDGNLYGTTISGGDPDSPCSFRREPGCGTVFMLDKKGKQTVLYRFTGGADGANPQAVLVRDSAGNLYGTTTAGGTFGFGTVFMVNGESRETVLYSFTGGTDGGGPVAGLVRDSQGNLYGTTLQGGSAKNPSGTVFKVSPSGQEIVLHSFTGETDGGFPLSGGLSQDAAGNLYGTTQIGGTFGPGVAFRIHP